MDIELLRTFVEVYRTHHFGHAAENLYLTQSAVSARIRLLERALGTPLFTRSRNNIQLTAAGHQLLPHAESILGTWNRARQQTASRQDQRVPVIIGGAPNLWEVLLQAWLCRIYATQRKIRIEAEVHSAEVLQRRTLAGELDLIFAFEPPASDELLVREVAGTALVMVSATAATPVAEALGQGYVYVDWGRSFSIAHAQTYPDGSRPAARVPTGRMALEILLQHGGSAYLPESMIAANLAQGTLHRVIGAAPIERLVYAAYAVGSEHEREIERLLVTLPPHPSPR